MGLFRTARPYNVLLEEQTFFMWYPNTITQTSGYLERSGGYTKFIATAINATIQMYAIGVPLGTTHSFVMKFANITTGQTVVVGQQTVAGAYGVYIVLSAAALTFTTRDAATNTDTVITAAEPSWVVDVPVKFVRTAGGANVKVYTSGTLRATHTTNIPQGTIDQRYVVSSGTVAANTLSLKRGLIV